MSREHTGETNTKIMSGDLRSNLNIKENTKITAQISPKGLMNTVFPLRTDAKVYTRTKDAGRQEVKQKKK